MNNPCNQPCPYNTLRGCTILEHPGKYCPMGNMPKKEYKPLTNGDRIRAMTDEELAYWMTHLHEDGHCLNERCQIFQDKTCEECVVDWLKHPAKED